MSLRDRCKEFVGQQSRNAMLRQGDPVEDLVAFVVSENGRAAAPDALDSALPLCLYFPTAEDREEFIAAVHEAKPNMIARRVL